MSKYLGDVSAYAYAVSKGYTGTEEEFAELMASYATVAEAAEASAQSAASSASSASGSASTASTAAQTATTKASEAAQSATGASQSATQAESAKTSAQASAQTATTKASEASQSATNAAGSATTANDAADDATAAKTAAETAKTAAETAKTDAETAQTAAETAAASVSASAAQIATNTADITDLKNNLEQYEDIFTGDVDESVQNWLDAHPEATTTVQDHSLTHEKLVKGTLGFVTPEMFGAVGDGVTDDTTAMNNCFQHGNIKLKSGSTYFVDYIDITSDSTVIDGNGATIKFNSNRSGQTIGGTSNIYKTECLSNRRSRTSQFDTFVMRDVYFDGGGASFSNYSDYRETYTALILLQLFNYKYVVIEDCHFYDTIQDAVWLDECEIVSITNCKFEQIAYNTHLTGTKNAITVGSSSKTSALIIQNNSFSYVYDECMRIDDFASVTVCDNTVYHCCQYFAEVFFNGVSGYSCNHSYKGNSINELLSTFINVGSSISTKLKINIESNMIKGLGSDSFAGDDHESGYGNVLQCAYQDDIEVTIIGNYVELINYFTKNAPLVNARYARLFMQSNTVVINNDYTSTSVIISASEAYIDNNAIVSAKGKTPKYSNIAANFETIAKITNNLIDLVHTDCTFYAVSGSATELHLIGNTINGLASTKSIFYTRSADILPFLIVSKNVIKTGRFLTVNGTVTNLIFTENILPTNFLLPTSTAFTNSIDDNNLKKIPV